MRYIPHTDKDLKEMFELLGIRSLAELFDQIPAKYRESAALDLPGPLSEKALVERLGALGEDVSAGPPWVSFLGAGAYDHFIPSAVRHLVTRSEFRTAYTPYQPELSQGTLQAIFEYQSLICQLTGMDVANASMYDGASAMAESVLMAGRIARGKRKKVVLSASIHPEYRQVLATYLRATDFECIETPWSEDGRVDVKRLQGHMDGETCCVVVQSPNFFGATEDLGAVEPIVHDCGALLISVVTEPISLGLLKPPGAWGADIVVGEGQSLGNPLNFGGPYLGIFATRQPFLRNMPGRLVGQTLDKDGCRGYVVTLATREQHIRREKATSNICTNESLCALAGGIYLCLLGKTGIREVAEQNARKAYRARKAIESIPGYRLRFSAPAFNEFVIQCPGPAAQVLDSLGSSQIVGGLDLGRFYPGLADCFVCCVTENRKPEEIERLCNGLEQAGRNLS